MNKAATWKYKLSRYAGVFQIDSFFILIKEGLLHNQLPDYVTALNSSQIVRIRFYSHSKYSPLITLVSRIFS